MSRAYQCDRCDEFFTTKPERYRVEQYHSGGAFGWMEEETRHKLELCPECGESFETTIGEWLEGDGEWRFPKEVA